MAILPLGHVILSYHAISFGLRGLPTEGSRHHQEMPIYRDTSFDFRADYRAFH